MTTALFLYSDDKDLEEIQQILTSIEEANMAKRVVEAVAILTIMGKRKKSERSESKPNEKCFNCRKKGYYTRDYHSSSLKKRKFTEESTEEAKYA